MYVRCFPSMLVTLQLHIFYIKRWRRLAGGAALTDSKHSKVTAATKPSEWITVVVMWN